MLHVYASYRNNIRQQAFTTKQLLKKTIHTQYEQKEDTNSGRQFEQLQISVLRLAKDYEIIHAQNGEEAIELFKEKQPDLILMDIGMPIMDGNEATKEIRKLSADIPIVGLTAYAYASDETKGLESGMNRYLTKPISITDLKEIVTEYME